MEEDGSCIALPEKGVRSFAAKSELSVALGTAVAKLAARAAEQRPGAAFQITLHFISLSCNVMCISMRNSKHVKNMHLYA